MAQPVQGFPLLGAQVTEKCVHTWLGVNCTGTTQRLNVVDMALRKRKREYEASKKTEEDHQTWRMCSLAHKAWMKGTYHCDREFAFLASMRAEHEGVQCGFAVDNAEAFAQSLPPPPPKRCCRTKHHDGDCMETMPDGAFQPRTKKDDEWIKLPYSEAARRASNLALDVPLPTATLAEQRGQALALAGRSATDEDTDRILGYGDPMEDEEFLHNGPIPNLPRRLEEEGQADEPQADEPQADEPHADEKEQADEPHADEPQADEKEQADEPHADENEQADEPHADEPQADEPQADEPHADEKEQADEPHADAKEQADEPHADAKEQADEPHADAKEQQEKDEAGERETHNGAAGDEREEEDTSLVDDDESRVRLAEALVRRVEECYRGKAALKEYLPHVRAVLAGEVEEFREVYEMLGPSFATRLRDYTFTAQQKRGNGRRTAPFNVSMVKWEGLDALVEALVEWDGLEDAVRSVFGGMPVEAPTAETTSASPEMILYFKHPYEGARPVLHVLDASKDLDKLGSKKVVRNVFVANVPPALLGKEMSQNAACIEMNSVVSGARYNVNKNEYLCVNADGPAILLKEVIRKGTVRDYYLGA